jgi:hypothetical protein
MTFGAGASNEELFAHNFASFRRVYPWQRLLRQTGHLIALSTEEVDVISGTGFVGTRLVSTKPPGAVGSLDPVEKARVIEGNKGSINRDAVQPFGLKT